MRKSKWKVSKENCVARFVWDQFPPRMRRNVPCAEQSCVTTVATTKRGRILYLTGQISNQEWYVFDVSVFTKNRWSRQVEYPLKRRWRCNGWTIWFVHCFTLLLCIVDEVQFSDNCKYESIDSSSFDVYFVCYLHTRFLFQSHMSLLTQRVRFCFA